MGRGRPRSVPGGESVGADRRDDPDAGRAQVGAATMKAPSAAPAHHEKDRFFPARLLMIIVIAALIGSALVLLLK